MGHSGYPDRRLGDAGRAGTGSPFHVAVGPASGRRRDDLPMRPKVIARDVVATLENSLA